MIIMILFQHLKAGGCSLIYNYDIWLYHSQSCMLQLRQDFLTTKASQLSIALSKTRSTLRCSKRIKFYLSTSKSERKNWHHVFSSMCFHGIFNFKKMSKILKVFFPVSEVFTYYDSLLPDKYLYMQLYISMNW